MGIGKDIFSLTSLRKTVSTTSRLREPGDGTSFGFETKKTIAIRYQKRELFERVLRAATRAEIFDLIKVDYVVSDFDTVRKQLFAAAAKVIRDKEKNYASALGVEMLPVGLANERYDAFFPSDTYERYQAYETGEASVSSSTTSSRLIRRKSQTFFYQPIDGNHFTR